MSIKYFHPLNSQEASSKATSGHKGQTGKLDFPYDEASLYAMCDGQVKVGTYSDGNNYICLQCTENGLGETFWFRYLHMDLSTVTVSDGQTVHKGQYLGKIRGNQGTGTGAHLHLDCSKKDTDYDPVVVKLNGKKITYGDKTFTLRDDVDLDLVHKWLANSGNGDDNCGYLFLIMASALEVRAGVSGDGSGQVLIKTNYTISNEYLSTNLSNSFMGKYPTSIDDLENESKGAYWAAAICSREMGYDDTQGQYAQMYGKLLRVWAMYPDYFSYNNTYLKKPTLETCCRAFDQTWNGAKQAEEAWNKRTSLCPKTDNNCLNFVQNIYKNIKYGGYAYGIITPNGITSADSSPIATEDRTNYVKNNKLYAMASGYDSNAWVGSYQPEYSTRFIFKEQKQYGYAMLYSRSKPTKLLQEILE